MRPFLNYLALFGSTGTLLCCALPTLFVALGLGAVVSGVITAFPQLVWLSEHKIYVFLFSGLLLVLSGWAQWQARNAPCPLDPELAKACTSARRFSLWVYGISVAIFMVGVFFAYLGPLILF